MPEPTDEQREAWELSQIRQRRSRVEPKPIGRVMRRLMASSGYGEIEANAQLRQQWNAAVGPGLAELSSPGRLARGVLIVHAANSAAMQEIHLRRKQILSALQRDQSQITDLRIRVSS